MNRFFVGDCRDVMRELIAQGVRVQACITSPPYDDLRTYGGYSWDFEATARALYDILTDGGVLCWIVGDSVVDGSETLTSAKQKIFFREKCGFRIHDTMIWHKLNFSSPSFNRYHQCFEYVIVLTKGIPRCFNPIKDRPNSTAGRIGNLGTNTFMKRDGSRETRSKYVTTEYGMRHNVWDGQTSGQENMCKELEHPAMMPSWLARDLIESWSNPGDTVLDPMAGSGTTGEAAQRLGREFIGVDINPEYVALAEKRTAQRGLVLI
jgi:DNA modification methylase